MSNRSASAGPRSDLTPIDLGDGVGTRVDQLLALDDGVSLVVASGDRVSTVDVASGDVTAALDLPGVADLAPGGTGSALVGTPSEMDDPATVAVTLADLIGGDAGAIEAKLLAGTDSVVLGSPGDAETRANVELAISDGTLARHRHLRGRAGGRGDVGGRDLRGPGERRHRRSPSRRPAAPTASRS